MGDPAVFRPETGLWVIRDHSRFYFGGTDDLPVPADFDGDGRTDGAVFRPSSGLWALKDLSRVYLDGPAICPSPATSTATAPPTSLSSAPPRDCG